MDVSVTSSAWAEVAEINEVLTRSTAPWDGNGMAPDVARVRTTLLRLTTASERLTGLLDMLASHYDLPGRAEPPTMHVALDQAAAAAEDLATCAKAAAEATDDIL